MNEEEKQVESLETPEVEDETYHATSNSDVEGETPEAGNEEPSSKEEGSEGEEEKPKAFGQEEFENLSKDKNYYKNKEADLQKKLEDAKAEQNNPYKAQKNNDIQNTADAKTEQMPDGKNGKNDANSKKQNKNQNSGKAAGAKKSEALANAKKQKELQKKKKKLKDKIRDRRNVRQAKRDIMTNKMASAKAVWFAVTHPIQFMKTMMDNLIKNVIQKFPVQSIIVILILVVVAIITLIILTLAMGSIGGSPQIHKYHYSQVLVKSGDEEVYLDEYALGATYAEFFIQHNIESYSLSDEKLKLAMQAYYLYAKTTALKDGYYPDSGDYKVSMSSGIWDHPSYCSAILGCHTVWFRYVSYDDEYDEEKKGRKEHDGLDSCDEDTTYCRRSDLLFDAQDEVSDYILAPASVTSAITSIDSSFEVPNLKKSLYNKIIDNAEKYSNLDDVIYYSGKDVGDKYEVVLYNINDYIIDSETAYVDRGYWWPIGSAITEVRDGITYADGEPAYSIQTDGYGYRYNQDGKRSFHDAIDLSAIKGTNVIAIESGTVIEHYCQDYDGWCGYKQEDTRFGWAGCHIVIDHENGTQSKYLHLTEDSMKYVTEGQHVEKGQLIGAVGSTGCSTASHLHFMIIEDGSSINPYTYVSENNARSGKAEEIVEDNNGNDGESVENEE